MHRGNDKRVSEKERLHKPYEFAVLWYHSALQGPVIIEPRYVLRKNHIKLKVNREVQRKQKRTQLNTGKNMQKVRRTSAFETGKRSRNCKVWHHFIKHRVLDFRSCKVSRITNWPSSARLSFSTFPATSVNQTIARLCNLVQLLFHGKAKLHSRKDD